MVRKRALFVSVVLAAACGAGADTRDDSARVAEPGGAVSGDVSAAGSGAIPTDTGSERASIEPAAGSDTTAAADARTGQRRTIVFLGTSLTAGYGVGEDQAFPAVIQERIDSAGLPFQVVNAGISGETSAGGLARIDWVLRGPVDVLVLELGANDGLRGLPVDRMRANLDSILVRTRRAYPAAAIVIAGMEAPPNLGDTYTAEFRRTFSDLATLRDAALVPFLLEDVGGVRSLNQDDGIHPTAGGHRMLADNVWVVLAPLLEGLGSIEREAARM
jgi:acyl-CoA thioesterase-1